MTAFYRVGDAGYTGADDAPTIGSTWLPVDLTDALAGHRAQPPTMLARADGVHLIYPGRVHWIMGEPESLKTWLAVLLIAQVINDGGDALWIDFEDEARTIVGRLLALGVTAETIAAHFTYIRPDEPLADRHGLSTLAGLDLDVTLAARAYRITVIDGVTEGMTMEGLDLLGNADIATWMRRLPKRIALTGSGVACLDHLTKNRETGGRFAIGGQHKLAGIDGAAYRLDVLRPFSRAVVDPTIGTASVTVTKDRPGWVRSYAKEGRVAVLELQGWPDGGVTAHLTASDAAPTPDLKLCLAILTYLGTYNGASKNAIELGVEGKAAGIRDALVWMADRGWLEVRRVGQSHQHHLTDAGRKELP